MGNPFIRYDTSLSGVEALCSFLRGCAIIPIGPGFEYLCDLCVHSVPGNGSRHFLFRQGSLRCALLNPCVEN